MKIEQKCCVIIVAGGKGKRMVGGKPKQFLELKEKPILAHSVEKFETNENIDDIIIVVGKEEKEYCEKNVLEKYEYKKLRAVVEGGKERQDSVSKGLEKVSKDVSIVLVHDAVRPFVSQKEINDVINTAIEKKACVLAVPVKDTIKYIDQDGTIEHTLDRKKLWAMQTPQGFSYDILMEAYEWAKKNNYVGTDDASLVEAINQKIYIVEGSYRNIKITTREDLDHGKTLLSNL